MKVSNDMKERLKIGALWLFQSYKVIMGSMLILFVPQKCEELILSDESGSNNLDEYKTSICTISQNLNKKDDIFHDITLGFNFLCVGLFLITYIVELRREHWCVKNLDINHDYPDNHLDNIIHTKPELKKELHKRNNRYFKITTITSSIYMINLLLSSIIIYNNYVGIQAVTSYTSYVALILLKIYNSLFISYTSLKHVKALSSYITEFSSFNVFDEDLIIQDKPKKQKEKKDKHNKDKINHNDVDLNINP